MYYLKLFNDNSVIEATDRVLTLEENKAEILNFTLLPNSPFFAKLKKQIHHICVYEDDERRVITRVIKTEKIVSSDGKIVERITCEGVLNFLNDTRTKRWAIHPGKATSEDISWQTDEEKQNDPYIIKENMTVKQYLKLLLDNHNSKVSKSKQIFLGNVDIEDSVYCYNDRETTLNAIQDKLISKFGGVLNIRLEDDDNGDVIYYLDYLKEIKQEEGLIELGVNIAYYNQSNNTDVIYTRITPIGADHLTIKKANNNVEYVDNEELKAIYGIVEHVAEFPEVTNAENLKNKAINLFETINNASDIFEINVLDISYISANFKRFRISQKCRIKNNIFGTDEVRRIVSMTILLDEPHKTTLNLSQNTNTMTSTTARLIQSVKNNNINNYNANTKISAVDSSVNKVNAKFEKQRKYNIMGV